MPKFSGLVFWHSSCCVDSIAWFNQGKQMLHSNLVLLVCFFESWHQVTRRYQYWLCCFMPRFWKIQQGCLQSYYMLMINWSDEPFCIFFLCCRKVSESMKKSHEDLLVSQKSFRHLWSLRVIVVLILTV